MDIFKELNELDIDLSDNLFSDEQPDEIELLNLMELIEDDKTF